VHWAKEGDKVHVDSCVALWRKESISSRSSRQGLWDVNGAAVGGSLLGISESAQKMIDKGHDGSEMAQASDHGLGFFGF
jgi:hypothetical protein